MAQGGSIVFTLFVCLYAKMDLIGSGLLIQNCSEFFLGAVTRTKIQEECSELKYNLFLLNIDHFENSFIALTLNEPLYATFILLSFFTK